MTFETIDYIWQRFVTSKEIQNFGYTLFRNCILICIICILVNERKFLHLFTKNWTKERRCGTIMIFFHNYWGVQEAKTKRINSRIPIAGRLPALPDFLVKSRFALCQQRRIMFCTVKVKNIVYPIQTWLPSIER